MGGSEAACSAVVAASEAANGVDPTDEQLDRLWDAIDGIRGIASADSRPLYAAPAPSRPADREEIADLIRGHVYTETPDPFDVKGVEEAADAVLLALHPRLGMAGTGTRPRTLCGRWHLGSASAATMLSALIRRCSRIRSAPASTC